MAAEPIVIYSHKVDPLGVLACLRKLTSRLNVTEEGRSWSRVVVEHETGLFQKSTWLAFSHDPNYYANGKFPMQMRGMQGYFAQFQQNELTPRIMMLIASFRFSIALHPPPQPELILDSRDPRLKYLFAVVRHLEGAIFTPSGLRDAEGRVLYGVGASPQAVMPPIYAEAPHPSEMPAYKGGTMPNPAGPPADRVARRALCLYGVALRGMTERDQGTPERLEEWRAQLERWVDAVGIGSELEPQEWRLLKQPVAPPQSKELMDAEWLMEGAAVLVWALGRLELPPYDEQVDVAPLGRGLGYGADDKARAFVAEAKLRPREEIERLSRQILGIHWRIREQNVRPGRIDFERVSQDAWFGKLPLQGVRFIDGDLAIGAHPIHAAPAMDFKLCAMAVYRRHMAINWLCGDNPVYSKTDTQT